jgi:hypothetical protein
VAHAVDFATANALPAAAGVLPFAQMTPAGQAMGVVWCLVGFAQLLGNDRGSRQALAIAYGAYEILLTLATGAVTSDPSNLPVRLGAAAGLQAVVYYCYVQLRQKSLDESADAQPAPRASNRGRGAAAPKVLAARTRPGQTKSPVRGRGAPKAQPPKSFQERLEDAFGKDLFKGLVFVTGVLCYPLILYGIVNKPH